MKITEANLKKDGTLLEIVYERDGSPGAITMPAEKWIDAIFLEGQLRRERTFSRELLERLNRPLLSLLQEKK